MTQVKVRSLFAELGFEIKNLKKAQEFEDAVENIRAGMEQIVSVARTTALAITGAATAMTLFQKGQAKNAAVIKRTAEGLEVNVENLQALQFAYEQLGVDDAEMVDSFQKLSDRVEKAAKGSKEYQRGLKLIGVSAKELQKLDMGSAYDTVIEKIAALEEPQKRLSALTVIFGETLARKLSPALAENGKLLTQYLNLARETGAVMSKDQVDALAALDFQFVRMQGMLTAIKKQLSAALLPVFERTITRVWNWYKANQQLVETKVVEFAERLSDAVETAANMFKQLNAVVQEFGGWLSIGELSVVAMAAALVAKLGSALSVIAGGVKALFGAFASLAGIKLAALFGVIVITGLLLASAFEEMAGDARGAESVFQDLMANFDNLNPILQLLALLLNQARLVWKALTVIWTEAVLPALKNMAPLLYVVAGVIGVVAAAVLSLIVLIAAWVAGLLFITGLVVQFGITLLQIPRAIKDIIDLMVEMVKWAVDGFDPASDAIAGMREEVAQLFEVMADMPALDFIADKLGVDLQAEANGLRFRNNVAPGLGGTAAAAGGTTNTTNTTNQAKVEQNNTFIVQGSMDKQTGKKVAKEAGKASQSAANSINNAARSGNR